MSCLGQIEIVWDKETDVTSQVGIPDEQLAAA